MHFGTQSPVLHVPLTSDVYNPTFSRFRVESNLESQKTDEQLLENLGLNKTSQDGRRPTNALILLFSNSPENIYPQCRSIVYQMNAEAKILDQKIFAGNLFEQMRKVFEYLKQNLRTSLMIDGLKHSEASEFPDYVLRELIVNGLIHRDYFERGAEFVVKIFPERIEFSNPGPILNGKSVSYILGRSLRKIHS